MRQCGTVCRGAFAVIVKLELFRRLPPRVWFIDERVRTLARTSSSFPTVRLDTIAFLCDVTSPLISLHYFLIDLDAIVELLELPRRLRHTYRLSVPVSINSRFARLVIAASASSL